MLHHIELWVPDLARAVDEWGWLLGELGWLPYQEWEHGRSWRSGPVYLVVERSPALQDGRHERCRAGLNHLAFRARRRIVDVIAADAPGHGWAPIFTERFPYAGGPNHYAAYLENGDGFEVEIVAAET